MVFGSDYCHGVGGRYTEWHTTVSLAVHKGNGKFILDMIRSGNLIPTPSLHHFLTVSHFCVFVSVCLFPPSGVLVSFVVFCTVDFRQSFPDCAIARICC